MASCITTKSASLKNETENSYYKVKNYYKVITKFDRSLLQSASGIAKCDRLLLQSAPRITKLFQSVTEIYYKVRQVLQSVAGITKCDRLLLQSA